MQSYPSHSETHDMMYVFAMTKCQASEELQALNGRERKRCPKGPIARRLPLYPPLSGRRILSPIYIWPHLGFGEGFRNRKIAKYILRSYE